MTDYKNQLQHILDYAIERGSWSKKLLTKNADVVCAYGLGQYFKDTFNHPQWDFKNYLHINYCCDKDVAHGKEIAEEYGITFTDFDSLQKMNIHQNVVVVLFIGNPEELAKEFRLMGLNVITLSECFFEKICNMPSDVSWFKENKLMEVFDILEDELSKRNFVNILAQRLNPLMAEYSYSDLKSGGEYFQQDFMPLSEKEVFCDCGAYTGDTVERFLKAVNGCFEYIYAYEMAEENYLQLTSRVQFLEKQYPNMSPDKYCLMRAGVWDHKGSLFYGKEEKGSSESYGFLKTDNQVQAEVVTLDETTNLPVTFIKMDIEGAELNALSGGDKCSPRIPSQTCCLSVSQIAGFLDDTNVCEEDSARL